MNFAVTWSKFPVRALKRLAGIYPSNVDKLIDENEPTVLLCNYTDVYYNERITDVVEFARGSATLQEIERFSLKPGDVIITKDSEAADDIAVPAIVESDIPGLVCGYHLAILRPRNASIEPRFLFWALKARPLRDSFTIRAKGITRFGLTVGDIWSVLVPWPAFPTQQRIADFLDRETARINHVIMAKRRLMTLLEEKRLATITYAVTKGVSSNGVVDTAAGERVDMVPLDWQVIRFRRVIKRIEQGWSPPSENRPVQQGEWGVLKVGCVNRGRFRPEEHKALPPEVEPRPELEVRDGDLLMSRGNTHDLVGSAAIASNTPPRLMLSDLLYRIVLDERVVRPRFAMYALNGYPLRSQIEACASGSSDSMPKISQEKIKELTWAVPPLVEQDAVVAYLDSHLERIDQLLQVIDRSVRCLEEFRSTLITAAVTGQIDPDTWRKRGETDRRLEAIEAEVNE